jgi:hypothetical protein
MRNLFIDKWEFFIKLLYSWEKKAYIEKKAMKSTNIIKAIYSFFTKPSFQADFTGDY